MEGEWKEMSQHMIPEQKDYSYISKRAIIELSAAAQHRALFLPILQKHLIRVQTKWPTVVIKTQNQKLTNVSPFGFLFQINRQQFKWI